MKTHYSEFVRHCLRHYVRTMDDGKGGCPIFKSDAERENWRACHSVLKDYSKSDADIIFQIYRNSDTVAYNIYLLAKSKGVSQDKFWRLVSRVEKSIASKRGLI